MTSAKDTGAVRTTVTLTVLSLAAPLLSGGDTATVVALLALHAVAAGVVIPAVARNLRTRTV